MARFDEWLDAYDIAYRALPSPAFEVEFVDETGRMVALVALTTGTGPRR